MGTEQDRHQARRPPKPTAAVRSTSSTGLTRHGGSTAMHLSVANIDQGLQDPTSPSINAEGLVSESRCVDDGSRVDGCSLDVDKKQHAGSDRRPFDSQQPYCPDRYKDSGVHFASASSNGPSVSIPDRVAQLRSQLQHIQEMRARTDAQAESGRPSALPRSRPDAERYGAEPTAGNSSRTASRAQSPAPQPTLVEAKDKLSSILGFLDEVEETSRADISSITSARSAFGDSRGALDAPGLRRGHPTGLTDDALALQSRVHLLEVEVHDKKRIIEALQRTLSEAKERERQALADVTREADEKMGKQRMQLEAGVERQLQLVDRLLNDKAELTKRCGSLVDEVKAVERKFQLKIEEMDEQATKELARQKQNWAATERLRREAWEKEKTREIKDITIKGLQPEVERILAERKQERNRMEERHRDELEQQRRELQETAQAQVQHAREQTQREQERLLDAEREIHRRKLREEFERASAQLADERAKCSADVNSERRKCDQFKQQEIERSEAALRKAVLAERAKAEEAVKEARELLQKQQDEARRELEELKIRTHQEKDAWQRQQEADSKAGTEQRLAKLRQDLQEERERQIEVLVDRLGHEHVQQHREAEARFKQALESSKQEAQEEARQLAKQLDDARRDSQALEHQLALMERTLQGCQSTSDVSNARAADLQRRLEILEAERSSWKDEAALELEKHRDELWRVTQMKDRELEQLRCEFESQAKELADERRKAEERNSQAKQHEDKLMSDLESRVKRTLQAKDDQIAELRKACAASENKAREFEYLLARQREELLTGLTRSALS